MNPFLAAPPFTDDTPAEHEARCRALLRKLDVADASAEERLGRLMATRARREVTLHRKLQQAYEQAAYSW